MSDYWPGTTGWSSTFAGRPALSLNPFNYTINNGTITITRYIGFGGAVSIAIPSTLNNLPVTTIGQDAFESINMTSVTIPDSVTIIGDAALGGCTNLTSIIIPNSVTSIGYAALDSCTSLASVMIGSGVTNIGDFAFSYCTSLKSITVDPLNSVYSSLDGVLFDKSQATLIQCPPSCEAGNYTIPNSVTNIGPVAFASCVSLTSVTIPNTITGIGSSAFDSCIRMTSVYFNGNAISVDSSVFNGDRNVTIYYLSGTTGWVSTFGGFPTALWKPQVQTGDSSFGVRTNQFGFNINWASGMVVVVEACTNFSTPVWKPVKTNTIFGSSSYFSDSNWTNYHARFYRLRSP